MKLIPVLYHQWSLQEIKTTCANIMQDIKHPKLQYNLNLQNITLVLINVMNFSAIQPVCNK